MKFSDCALDHEGIEAGAWRPAEGLLGVEFKLKGVPNSAWTALEQKLGARGVAPEEIRNRCLLEACLLDWRGIDADDGTPELFSAERAQEVITKPEFRLIRTSITSTALIFGGETAGERRTTQGG